MALDTSSCALSNPRNMTAYLGKGRYGDLKKNLVHTCHSVVIFGHFEIQDGRHPGYINRNVSKTMQAMIIIPPAIPTISMPGGRLVMTRTRYYGRHLRFQNGRHF